MLWWNPWSLPLYVYRYIRFILVDPKLYFRTESIITRTSFNLLNGGILLLFITLGINMWKNILATAVLVLSVGVSYRLIQTADANLGAMVSYGANPVVNFGGTVTSTGEITTAPTNQDIILTTIITNGTCSVLIDGVEIVPAGGYFNPTYLYIRPQYAGTSSSFTLGAARLKVPAGSTLSLGNCSGNRYYMNGYMMQP